jgi:outer membrane immunogenic protein
MKRQLIMGAVVAACFAAPAMAADLKVKPAPVTPVANWTACYVGGQVGYGWSRFESSDNPNSNFLLGQTAKVDASGFIGGGQVGCDLQWNSAFVIGIEADYAASGMKGSTTPAVPFLNNLTAYARTNSFATVTGRIGIDLNGYWLLYVKGGAAWAHNKYSADWAFAPFSGTLLASETRPGWTFGVGLEHIFAGPWSVRLEYDYYNFGTRSITFPVGAPLIGTNYIGDISHEAYIVKMGVNYRFGGAVAMR